MRKIALGLIFGGASSEYEVSLLSATSVLNNINPDKYDVYRVGISKSGRIFYYTGPVCRIAEDRWQGDDCISCVISPDRGDHGLLLLKGQPELIRLDCVFPVLHGKNGEDGTIQGLLSMAGIPYVGCGYLSSAACMDKIVTHTLLDAAGIPGTKWLGITEYEYRKDEAGFAGKAGRELGYPCFVKPANAGSSVGITRVEDEAGFAPAMKLAFHNDRRVIVEKMAAGKEVECAVLGNEEPVASPLGEIEPCNNFYDYNAKYIDGKTKTYIPARISAEAAKKIREMAVQAYKEMGCRGMARVDFFARDDGSAVLNEINTIPGFTDISMYPQLFMESGMTYSGLIDRLISLAMEDAQ